MPDIENKTTVQEIIEWCKKRIAENDIKAGIYQKFIDQFEKDRKSLIERMKL